MFIPDEDLSTLSKFMTEDRQPGDAEKKALGRIIVSTVLSIGSIASSLNRIAEALERAPPLDTGL